MKRSISYRVMVHFTTHNNETEGYRCVFTLPLTYGLQDDLLGFLPQTALITEENRLKSNAGRSLKQALRTLLLGPV